MSHTYCKLLKSRCTKKEICSNCVEYKLFHLSKEFIDNLDSKNIIDELNKVKEYAQKEVDKVKKL